ncbi:hypothetical protein QF046_002173 [Microbacterium sp. W4I4]|nr:hypothetical protein [Microbacterium sp. W4I4]
MGGAFTAKAPPIAVFSSGACAVAAGPEGERMPGRADAARSGLGGHQRIRRGAGGHAVRLGGEAVAHPVLVAAEQLAHVEPRGEQGPGRGGGSVASGPQP